MSSTIIITPPPPDDPGGRSATNQKSRVTSVTIEVDDSLTPNEAGHEVAKCFKMINEYNG